MIRNLKNGNYEKLIMTQGKGLQTQRGLDLLKETEVAMYKDAVKLPVWGEIKTRSVGDKYYHERTVGDVIRRAIRNIEQDLPNPDKIMFKVRLLPIVPFGADHVERNRIENDPTPMEIDEMKKIGIDMINHFEKEFKKYGMDILKRRDKGKSGIEFKLSFFFLQGQQKFSNLGPGRN